MRIGWEEESDVRGGEMLAGTRVRGVRGVRMGREGEGDVRGGEMLLRVWVKGVGVGRAREGSWWCHGWLFVRGWGLGS